MRVLKLFGSVNDYGVLDCCRERNKGVKASESTSSLDLTSFMGGGLTLRLVLFCTDEATESVTHVHANLNLDPLWIGI